MPVISTLANVSLSVAQKKKNIMEDGNFCRCWCNCHQPPLPPQQQAHMLMHALWKQPTKGDVFNWPQTLNKKQGLSFSDVQRTPFCAFNGKAYAVPIHMTNQFNASLQYAQSGAVSPDWGSLYLSMQFPGLLWRHDPYSAKVLGETLNPSVYPLCAAEGQKEFAAFGDVYEKEEEEGDEDDGRDDETEQKEPAGAVQNSACSPTAPNHAAWNPMCVFHSTSSLLGTMLCLPTTGGTSSSGVYSDFSQPLYTGMAPTQQSHHKGSCAVTAARADEAAEQRRDRQNSVLPVEPSARPFPFATGRCVVVRSVPPPAANSGPTTASHVAPAVALAAAECGDESGPAGPQGNLVSRHAQRSRCPYGGGDDRVVDESSEARLPTLSVFRSLPPLFTDLAAHANRRPSALGKANGSDGPARADEVRYVYLVGHRCRRTLCAAPALHDVGTMVVLEGDMGIEMGTVRAVLPLAEFDRLDAAELAQHGFPTDHDVMTAALILRTATAEETEHYTQTLGHLAKDLLNFLQHHLNPSNFLDCHVENMEFLDCEFQADGKKIYVYYRARKRVLFRELAQYLHSFYRCRIWLHEVGKTLSMVSGDSSQDTETS